MPSSLKCWKLGTKNDILISVLCFRLLNQRSIQITTHAQCTSSDRPSDRSSVLHIALINAATKEIGPEHRSTSFKVTFKRVYKTNCFVRDAILVFIDSIWWDIDHFHWSFSFLSLIVHHSNTNFFVLNKRLKEKSLNLNESDSFKSQTFPSRKIS